MADSLDAALRAFTHHRETLHGANVWRSGASVEQRITPARSFKSMRIAKWPPGGVALHLKRFDNGGRKRAGPVDLPLRWGGRRLAAAVLHHGAGLAGGHYTALVRGHGSESETWYHCNDSSISRVDGGDKEVRARARHAYLALYLPVADSSLEWWR